MEILTTEEFRKHPGAVLANLLRGHSFLLIENDVPVAQLLFLERKEANASPMATSELWHQQLQSCRTIFDDAALARILGLTQRTFILLNTKNLCPDLVQARLEKLSKAVLQQRCLWTPRRILRWWKTPNFELQNASPVDYLARPWRPEDDRSKQVFSLIRREFLLSDETAEVDGWPE